MWARWRCDQARALIWVICAWPTRFRRGQTNLSSSSMQERRPVRLCRQATSSPARQRPGDRSARLARCPLSTGRPIKRGRFTMFRSLFRQLAWDCALDSEGRSRCRRRPARRADLPLRCRPRLEFLEDRSVPSTLIVTSAADDGSAGTLRAVLASAQDGDTIRFSHRLEGQTITLTLGQLLVNHSLEIDGPGANELAISGNAAIRIFAVNSATSATISGLTLTAGRATDGAAIL